MPSELIYDCVADPYTMDSKSNFNCMSLFLVYELSFHLHLSR